jgi:hypothetical protein
MFRFLYDDLKVILQHIGRAPTVVEFSKLIVFFEVNDDPEIFDLFSDIFHRLVRKLTVEEILTVLVNIAHTLSPTAQELFSAANQEFV